MRASDAETLAHARAAIDESAPAPLHLIPAELRADASRLRMLTGDAESPLAKAYDAIADRVERRLHTYLMHPLPLSAAAAESGYSAAHLGDLIRDGKLPNAGRPNSPRILRRDLPYKPGFRGADAAATVTSVSAVASLIDIARQSAAAGLR